jgi:hypothetical protein
MNFIKILLGLLATWATSIVILGFFDLQIYFPFNIGSAQDIPYHRWQTVRFTTFLTISYFIIRFVSGSRPVSALGVLDMFFKIMVVVGIINFWIADVLWDEWGVLVFFVIVSVMLHRAAKLNRGTMFVKHW